MLDRELAFDDVISPLVSARIARATSELKGKISGAADVSCTLRHVAKGSYEAVVAVSFLQGKRPGIVARKEGSNVFAVIHLACKAARQQAMRKKRRRVAARHQGNGEFAFPLVG